MGCLSLPLAKLLQSHWFNPDGLVNVCLVSFSSVPPRWPLWVKGGEDLGSGAHNTQSQLLQRSTAAGFFRYASGRVLFHSSGQSC